MKKLFTFTSDNGDKLKIRVERNEDLSWKLDHIAPDFGCKPDVSEPPNYKVGDFVYHIRDKYVFRVKSRTEFFLTSPDEDFINVVYCRPASILEAQEYLLELLRRQAKGIEDRELKSSLYNCMSTKGKLRMSIDNLIRDGFGTVGHVQKLKDIVDGMTGLER